MSHQGFTTHHITESGLLKVTSDLLLVVDSGTNIVLLLLCPTAAFDKIDHGIPLSLLEHWVCIALARA